MFPFRHSSIFRSRWIALIWSAGIIWSAIEFTEPQEKAADGNRTITDASGSRVGEAQKLLEKLN